jgi:hypothetical protein
MASRFPMTSLPVKISGSQILWQLTDGIGVLEQILR